LRDPVKRYVRYSSLETTPADGVVIGLTRDGSLERVHFAESTWGRKALLNELEVLGIVRHENVVALKWALRHEKRLFVTTSWVQAEEGEPTPVPLPILLRRVASVARGVAAIHRAGFVHGDLKPATLLFYRDRGLVTDLKFAQAPGRPSEKRYNPRLTAPEQMLGEWVGPPADVYALGIHLYDLFLKGRFPPILRTASSETGNEVGSEDLMLSPSTAEILRSPRSEGRAGSTRKPAIGQIAEAVIGAKVKFRSHLARVVEGTQHADLMGDVLAIVRKATRMDPALRYPDAAHLADALEHLLERLPAP